MIDETNRSKNSVGFPKNWKFLDGLEAFGKPQFLTGYVFAVTALLLATEPFESGPIPTIDLKPIISIILGSLSVLLMSPAIFKSARHRREIQFTDIDKGFQSREIQHHDTSEDKSTVDNINTIETSSFESYTGYAKYLNETFLNQIRLADTKASNLLDRGTTTARSGIWLFIASVFGWQVYLDGETLQTHHIFGMVSCSLVFIFIEFLAAWNFKQYRQFVDTSTYLMKVKSIFDKYHLCYLTASGNQQSSKTMLDILKPDIKWPDTYLLKSPDINFVKELLETMSIVTNSMKDEAKNTTSKQPN